MQSTVQLQRYVSVAVRAFSVRLELLATLRAAAVPRVTSQLCGIAANFRMPLQLSLY
jgi:hypothetical protein